MKLIVLSGPASGERYKVDHPVTIGRDPSNDIILPDPSVSLVHCEIYYEGGYAYLKDLGSTNGITLNGGRIISAELKDGDGLIIGKNKIRVEFPSASDTSVPSAMPTFFDQGDNRLPLAKTVVVQQKRKELSGNIFGNVTYFLKRKIADGGMGSVYEAEQFGAEGFIKKVAIKTILPDYAKRIRFVASFVGEAKLVANLVHQNIVQIHHLGRHDNGYYIAMEFIEGINLTDFLDHHRKLKRHVPFDMATFIASRISRGLEYAHSKKGEDGRPLGLVHRDVSPNNIMITREGEVKLTDFGVAKARQFMEDDDEYLVGSVEYMSPEQADCATVDGRSDLFSMGLLYYELLTGIRVFLCQNDDINATIERVKEAVIPDPRSYRNDIPDAVVKNLMRCLSKKPEDRFQAAGEVCEALEREMYSRGYGPTIMTLSTYIENMEKDLAARRKPA